MNKVLLICGPTATGKTALADLLAQKFDGELISADSRQVYKGLDIVTGKDVPVSRIHGYDLVKPNEEWNASLFSDFALQKIAEITKKGKLPIVVGGTGLYLKSIRTPLNINVPPNPKLREKLEQLSLAELQTKLKKINPDRFNSMNYSDQQNPRRLIRALEISSAKSAEKQTSTPPLDHLTICLTAPLPYLEKKIRQRVIKRLNLNPLPELEYLQKFNLPPRSPSYSSLGYQELAEYYAGKITRPQLVNLWTTRERNYAKRQLTWFKKQPNLHWFDLTSPHSKSAIVDLISSWYARSNA